MSASRQLAIKKTWRNSYIHIAILALCFVGLYYDVIAKMIGDWMNNDNYSHGFLIPLISGYLIWQKKEKLSEISSQPSNAGLLILAGGLLLFIAATMGAELFTMRFSILIVLVGLVVFFSGQEFGKAVSLPIGYLIFMIPLPAIIWNKIAFPLKLFATKISAGIIQGFGISLYREGNILHLANTSLEVVDACSGLRSLTCLLALSAAFALITHHSKAKKWILFISAVPIAIGVNIIRLIVTAFLAETYGPQVADGFLHNTSGILVFFGAIILLFCMHVFLGTYYIQGLKRKTLGWKSRINRVILVVLFPLFLLLPLVL